MTEKTGKTKIKWKNTILHEFHKMTSNHLIPENDDVQKIKKSDFLKKCRFFTIFTFFKKTQKRGSKNHLFFYPKMIDFGPPKIPKNPFFAVFSQNLTISITISSDKKRLKKVTFPGFQNHLPNFGPLFRISRIDPISTIHKCYCLDMDKTSKLMFKMIQKLKKKSSKTELQWRKSGYF